MMSRLHVNWACQSTLRLQLSTAAAGQVHFGGRHSLRPPAHSLGAVAKGHVDNYGYSCHFFVMKKARLMCLMGSTVLQSQNARVHNRTQQHQSAEQTFTQTLLPKVSLSCIHRGALTAPPSMPLGCCSHRQPQVRPPTTGRDVWRAANTDKQTKASTSTQKRCRATQPPSLPAHNKNQPLRFDSLHATGSLYLSYRGSMRS